ncbi:hypothetical protein EK21DRAFT_51425 [Setomelanomma holmii]|uniref:Uncharacterized protein n=1 Tax=Setomelanomma holmii TaxID=210430 RepID=A0A9P4HN48_9PLEO|nr:hypothetical protein EK21DRAFT_51425 [Setomelanomma holmii]
MTYANDTDDRGAGDPTYDRQVERRAPDDNEHTVATTVDQPDFNAIDDFNNSNDTTANNTQTSALFCGSQPTQLANPPTPLSPFSSLFQDSPSDLALPSGPVLTAPLGAQPIRMVNLPVDKSGQDSPDGGKSKRPVNTYRGKDPIKKIVQNKKLQAILADRPVPGERRKMKEERVELRLGAGRVLR